LAQIAAEFDLDIGCIDGPEIKAALFEATATSKALGHFGVPSMQLDDRFYWGADRLHFVARDLGCEPISPIPAAPKDSPPVLEFFHDFSSPFSYLASTQMERIAAENGATLLYRPILLGALFKAIGTPNIPLFEMTPARQAHQFVDMQHWAEWWGVEIRFPSVFPLRTVAALRVSILAPETTATLYRAAWVEDQEIGDPQVLQSVLEAAGFDGAALLAGTQDPAIKAQLFENTQRAVEKEVCGVPSMLIDDKVLVWGQDRMGMVEAAIDGWQPQSG
jgi:2-hydroxychromene-2-carboxylate isomerase